MVSGSILPGNVMVCLFSASSYFILLSVSIRIIVNMSYLFKKFEICLTMVTDQTK